MRFDSKNLLKKKIKLSWNKICLIGYLMALAQFILRLILKNENVIISFSNAFQYGSGFVGMMSVWILIQKGNDKEKIFKRLNELCKYRKEIIKLNSQGVME